MKYAHLLTLAVLAVGNHATKLFIKFPRVALEPPRNLKLTPVSSSSLLASWDAPQAATPNYYKIRWSGAGLVDEARVGATSFTINHLQPCRQYNVDVTAVEGDAESLPAAASQTTSAEIPPAPSFCEIVTPSKTELGVKWPKPETYCTIYTYNVSWAWQATWAEELGGEDWTSTKNTDVVIGGLAAGSLIEVQVAAKTQAGVGPAVACRGYTQEDVPTAPVVTGVSEGPESINLWWTPPLQANGVLLGYRVSWLAQGASGQKELDDGDATSATLEGLESCQTYNLTVEARTSVGYGSASDAWVTNVTGQAPLQWVTCQAVTPTNFSVSWHHAGLCHDTYAVLWSSLELWSQHSDEGSISLSGNASQYVFEAATPHTRYHVCVTPASRPHHTCCTDTTPMDAPSAPTNIAITSRQDTVNVSWAPPHTLNGVISSYRVSWQPDGGAEGGQEEVQATEAVLEGLKLCHKYAISVAAKTTVWGPPSEAQSVGLYNYVSGTSCAAGNHTMTLQFEVAEPDCQSPLDITWDVQVLWDHSLSYTRNDSCPDCPSHGSNTLYNVFAHAQVTACVWVTGRPHEALCCHDTTPQDYPERPRNVSVANTTTTSALLTWEAPHCANGVLGAYRVSWRAVDEDAWTDREVGPTMLTCRLDQLREDTDYLVTVSAETGAGWGPEANGYFTTSSNPGPGPGPQSGSPLWAIVGGVAAAVVVAGAAAAAVGTVWWRKRTKAKPEGGTEMTTQDDRRDSTKSEDNDAFEHL